MVLATVAGNGQITINSNHLPNAGDLLFARGASFLTDVDLEDTGPNHVWNFGFDVLEPGDLNGGTECVGIETLSIANQIFFNNPFVSEYDSDFGIGAAAIDNPALPVEDAYQIFKNGGGVYAITGIVATLSDVPIASQYNDRDVIYNLPLTYPGSGTSNSVLNLEVPTLAYYGTDQTREYVVDGWGTLNIYDQSFQVLRVKSHVTGFDSIYVSESFLPIPLGFQILKDITTYQWISTEYKLPILEVISDQGGFGGATLQVQTADIIDGAGTGDVLESAPVVYPNPTNNRLNVVGQYINTNATIYDQNGRLVWSGIITKSGVDVTTLQSGLYTLRIQMADDLHSVRFVKE